MKPTTIDWAKGLTRKYAGHCPTIKDDLFSAAMLGLAKTLSLSYCPDEGTVEFRNLASRMIKNAIVDEIRFHFPRRKRKGLGVTIGSLKGDIHPRREEGNLVEWTDLRAYLASQLTPGQSSVFLALYGEDHHQTFADAAKALGITPQCAYIQHQRAHKRLSILLRANYAKETTQRPEARSQHVA